MDPDDTIEALWVSSGRWASIAARLDELANTGSPVGSQLHDDNAAAAIVGESLAVSSYIFERAWNAARMLRALHRDVFETAPGRLHLNASVLYPLLRAAVEDASTIVWMLSPADRDERLTRGFRALFTDSFYFTENHLLLARAAPAVGAVPSTVGEALMAHMTAERAASREKFRRLASQLGLDIAESTRKLSTREPLKTQYGEVSVELTTWKLLSDLSHFSYLMLRHLATSPVPGSAVPLLHATFLQFTSTVNRVCDDAIEHLGSATAGGTSTESRGRDT
jgi:hypothetical protein